MKYSIFVYFFITILNSAADAQTVQTQPHPRFDSIQGEKLVELVDEQAQFPGGFESWKQFLSKNLNGSVPKNNGAPNGRYRVIVRFMVNKAGKLSDIHVESKTGFGMEEEVIRLLKRSPDWTPAQQNGRIVNSMIRQTVMFVVE